MRLHRVTASALRLRELPAGHDTGRRLMHDMVVTAHGDSYDGLWAYVSGPPGDGWASRAYLEPLPPGAVDVRRWPAVPHGLAGIRETFGEPGVKPTAEVVFPEPLPYIGGGTSTRFFTQPLLVPVFESVYDEVHRRGFWHLLVNFGGCFNDRPKRGTTSKKSTHAWSIAVDHDALRNRLGRVPTMDLRIVGVFRDHGFLWGGGWSRPDGMHFQYATGY